MKKVHQVNEDGLILQTWESQKDAAASIGVRPSTFTNAFGRYWPEDYVRVAGMLFATDMDIPGVMRCPCCGKKKTLTAFYRAKSRSTGYSYACAECEKRRVSSRQ